MMRNQWFGITTSRAVRRRPIGITRLGKPWVLWRTQDGEVRCAFDACPHRGAALSRGRVVDGDLECPYHGLRFGPDGGCSAVPCDPSGGHEDRFGLRLAHVREDRGIVWLWSGPDAPGEAPLPWDDAADAELGVVRGQTVDLEDQFDVSWFRIMENLTDFHHVPFVHRSTIPSSPELTAFSAHREGRHVRARGQIGGSMVASTHIVGPAFAVISFGGMATFAVVVCPIDDDHTWLFARYGQHLVRVPGLARLAAWVLGMFDYRLLQRLQDAPVWRSQRLEDPADIHRYTLLPADEGVRLYFEMVEELTP